MKSYLRLLPFTAVAAFLAGCASSGYEKAGTTSTSLRETARGIDNSLLPLDAVLVALSDLVNNPAPDIMPQFEKYRLKLSKLEGLSNDVSVHAAAMNSEGSAYFKKWDAELAKIQNDDIRTRSLDRKNEVAAHFERVRVSYAQTNAEFAPFMSGLKDIRTALATDLTAGGLTSVRALAETANENVIPLRRSLVSLSAEFKSLGVAMSSATPTT